MRKVSFFPDLDPKNIVNLHPVWRGVMLKVLEDSFATRLSSDHHCQTPPRGPKNAIRGPKQMFNCADFISYVETAQCLDLERINFVTFPICLVGWIANGPCVRNIIKALIHCSSSFVLQYIGNYADKQITSIAKDVVSGAFSIPTHMFHLPAISDWRSAQWRAKTVSSNTSFRQIEIFPNERSCYIPQMIRYVGLWDLLKALWKCFLWFFSQNKNFNFY